MTQNLNIKDAEKRVFRLATFEDGVWEIYLGLFFILMSCYSVTRNLLGPALNAILFLGLSFLLATIAVLARKRVVQPRIGLVQFGSHTRKKIKTAHLITVGLVLATFAILILSANAWLTELTWRWLPQWLIDFDVDLIFALIIIAFFSLIAYSTGVTRFYLHGVLLGVGNLATTILLAYTEAQFGWPVALAGLMIALIGVSVLFKFLQASLHSVAEVANGR